MTLSVAVELGLDLNDLTGTLTAEFQPLINLSFLDLSNNEFFGNFNSIFQGLGNLGKNLFIGYVSLASVISQLVFSCPFLDE